LSYLQAKNISSFLNICDLFVFPSLYEVGPQVVLEAKQCNAVCVVAPEGGGKRINNNFDGIIVKKYLLKEWVKEIEYLLVNKKKIKEIKNNLRLSNFQPSWSDVFFENFYNNWKKILEKK
jgi:glycosyltransferase involved in cell wall biosynthesis